MSKMDEVWGEIIRHMDWYAEVEKAEKKKREEEQKKEERKK